MCHLCTSSKYVLALYLGLPLHVGYVTIFQLHCTACCAVSNSFQHVLNQGAGCCCCVGVGFEHNQVSCHALGMPCGAGTCWGVHTCWGAMPAGQQVGALHFANGNSSNHSHVASPPFPSHVDQCCTNAAAAAAAGPASMATRNQSITPGHA